MHHETHDATNSKQRRLAWRHRLSTRFTLVTITILVVAMLLYIPWNIQREEATGMQSVLNEARTLNMEMSAVWNYVDAMQIRINYDATGRYEFKDVYCAVAAKAIAQEFTAASNYVIRYVREDPRVAPDEPDEFEQKALDAFSDQSTTEYYGISTYEDDEAFRYVTVITYKASCLECHGSPAGEKDPTGFYKEGMDVGDVAGAMSAVIPLDAMRTSIEASIVSHTALFAGLMIAIITAINVTFTLWVSRPARRLVAASSHVSAGEWEKASNVIRPSTLGEFGVVEQGFEEMAHSLRELQASLEERIASRTASLSSANSLLKSQQREIEQSNAMLHRVNEQLRGALQYKSEFLSLMSHELKTPIAAIVASLEIWLRTPDNSQEAERALVESIRRNSRELLSMVDNILDASKIEQRKLTVKPIEFDLVDLVNAAADSVNPLAREKEIALSWKVENDVPLVFGDAMILRRILDNVVGNALKFTPEHGSVRIEVAHLSQARQVRIDVSDTGVGIAEEDRERVFERFVQGETGLSRTFHGSGLGLSVARDLTRELEGDLVLATSGKSGSTFSIVIPVSYGNTNPEGSHEDTHRR